MTAFYLGMCCGQACFWVFLVWAFFVARWSQEGDGYGLLFRLGVLLFPFGFAWWTLRPAYRAGTRVLAFSWLALCLLSVGAAVALPALTPERLGPGPSPLKDMFHQGLTAGCQATPEVRPDECQCLVDELIATRTTEELTRAMSALGPGTDPLAADPVVVTALQTCRVRLGKTPPAAAPPPPVPAAPRPAAGDSMAAYGPGDDEPVHTGSEQTVVALTLEPAGAGVWLDGQVAPVGATGEIPVAPLAPHVLVVGMKGFVPRVVPVEILARGQRLARTVSLTRGNPARFKACAAKARSAARTLATRATALEKKRSRCGDRFACLEVEEAAEQVDRERRSRLVEADLCAHGGVPGK